MKFEANQFQLLLTAAIFYVIIQLYFMQLSSHILCNYPVDCCNLSLSYDDFSLLKYSLTFPSNFSGRIPFVCAYGRLPDLLNLEFAKQQVVLG